ncbi:YlaH-like family protein [Caldalkalibacillus salinus]|uniref:YlaH-like family protein n=1 Tax=Caldalkalibacillus salinus TaxID=2803787 RepID=UPI001924509F|nr:YlaH-like family protein [Caldalkalibacillus salinus]
MITDRLFVDGELTFGAFLILYLITAVLLGLVYKLGFERRLPVLKAFIVYVVLAIGALPLAFLGIALPFIEALIIAVAMLAIVRFRMKKAS